VPCKEARTRQETDAVCCDFDKEWNEQIFKVKQNIKRAVSLLSTFPCARMCKVYTVEHDGTVDYHTRTRSMLFSTEKVNM
jgi:hypothetical protein